MVVVGAYRVRVLKEAREGGGTYRVRTHGLRTHVTARLMLRSAGQERLGGLASAFSDVLLLFELAGARDPLSVCLTYG